MAIAKVEYKMKIHLRPNVREDSMRIDSSISECDIASFVQVKVRFNVFKREFRSPYFDRSIGATLTMLDGSGECKHIEVDADNVYMMYSGNKTIKIDPSLYMSLEYTAIPLVYVKNSTNCLYSDALLAVRALYITHVS